MKAKTFSKIKEYFKTHEGYEANHLAFVINKVAEAYFNNISIKNPQGDIVEKSDAEKAIIESALTTDENLKMYFDNAKTYFIEYDSSVEKLVIKKIDRSSFWKSIWASMLANFLYAVALILVLVVAKDQYKSLLGITITETEHSKTDTTGQQRK